MAKKLSGTVVQEVFYLIGKDATTGQKLYRRAPFDVVYINGGLHVRPWVGGMTDQALSLLAADTQEDKDMWRMDLGYELVNPIVMNENQMGDMSDNWMGLHAVSNI
jgi:hypothetical protein